MGIVGFGHIGRRVGELAHALGMGVLAEDEARSEPPAYQPFAWAGLDGCSPGPTSSACTAR
jgi:glycerate dehydrogenase